MRVHTWQQEKVDECYLIFLAFWFQIAAEGVFCCCNSSLALCAAEMLRESKRLALLRCLLKLTGRVTMMFVGERRYTGKETVWCSQGFSSGAPVG